MSEIEGQADVSDVQVVSPDIFQLQAKHKNGANWFYWIAGLSMVNSAIQMFNGEWGFIVGLFATQMVDAFALIFTEDADAGNARIVKGIAFAINIVIAFVFIGFGMVANRKQH